MGRELATRNANANKQCRMGWRRKGDDIAERLLDLGAAVVRLLPALSKKPGGKAVAKQLERCGPAGGANHEEARGAESPPDFIHKTRIALKDVRETRYWLRLAARAELLERTHHLATLIDEADQLVAILTASANTVRQRAESSGRCELRGGARGGESPRLRPQDEDSAQGGSRDAVLAQAGGAG